MISWRIIQKQNFTKWKELFSFLQLDEKYQTQILQSPRFPLNFPRRLAEKVEKNFFEDPILRQFLPTIQENEIRPGFFQDPVADETFRKRPKLLQKYSGRALLLATSACAMNCRFCFRQNFNYEIEEKGFEEELQAIADDPNLSEIILSGGDPLSLSDAALDSLITALAQIPHVKRLRFHTRFPIGIPERIDNTFLEILAKTRLQIVFVIHCNHPRELDEDVLSALKKIQRLGIPMLNSSVLLKGVNDNADVLKILCEKLADNGILPYYLHQLDPVQGAAHFEVAKPKGVEIIKTLRKQLSGYALPQYMQEIPGEAAKTPLS